VYRQPIPVRNDPGDALTTDWPTVPELQTEKSAEAAMPKVTWEGAEAYSLASHPRDGVQAGTAVEAFRFTTARPRTAGAGSALRHSGRSARCRPSAAISLSRTRAVAG
jgi:hypothetical protein